MNLKRGIYAMVVASTFFAAACDDDDENNNTDEMTLNNADRNFIENTSLSNLTEIEFGRLAVTKASDSSVRAFAQHMVNEHTTAQDELKGISDNFTGVTWSDSIDQDHQEIKMQLDSISGQMFDSIYIASQVSDHQKVLELFNMEASAGSHSQVKGYAAKYRPHIQEHLDMADSIMTIITDNADTTNNTSDTTQTGS
jgi:putative membrane protein